MKEKIRSILEVNESGWGRIVDIFIQVLIFISLFTFSLETIPDLSAQSVKALEFIETFCVIVFSLEYILRVYSAEKPLKYIFSFYGLIDLLAILPFYLNLIVDLRALRIFRIFRIFRAFKLVRYNTALMRFKYAYEAIKEELILFSILTGIMIFLTATGIYYFEHEAQPEQFSSIYHSFWWAIVTLTTVGYGDVYPITIGGKIFTFFVVIIGVGIVTVPAGLVATALSKARKVEEDEENP